MHDEMSEEAIAAIASQEQVPGEIARELVAKAGGNRRPRQRHRRK